MSEYLSVKDAAVLVNRSPDAVYLWIRQKKLPVVRDNLGRQFVLSVDVLRVEADQKRGRPFGVPSLKGGL